MLLLNTHPNVHFSDISWYVDDEISSSLIVRCVFKIHVIFLTRRLPDADFAPRMCSSGYRNGHWNSTGRRFIGVFQINLSMSTGNRGYIFKMKQIFLCSFRFSLCSALDVCALVHDVMTALRLIKFKVWYIIKSNFCNILENCKSFSLP